MNREARVGLVFLIGIAAALWLTVATGDVSQGEGAYAVHFPAVGSLDVGAAVRYNGVPVGRVRAIELRGMVEDAPSVAVRFDIEERFLDGMVVSEKTVFRIDEGMLGGSTLVIEHEGPGEPIAISALAGITGEKPANFNEAVREITAMIEENRGNLRLAIASLPAAVDNFSGMASGIRDVVEENRENVATTLQNVGRAGASITAAVEENRANLQAAIADIGGVFKDGRAALHNIWPRVQETANILPGTFQRIEGAAGQIQDAVAENRAYLRSTMESLAAAAPSIKRTSDNLATITDQVAAGEGTLGSLVMDDSLAKKAEVAVDSITARAEEVKPFTSGFSALRFYIGVDAGTDFNSGAGKASAYLRIEPRPWKFYQGGFTYRTAPSDRDTEPDDPDSLDVDWDLTLGWRFLPNDDRGLYHLTVEGGFVEGKLGGRVWVPIGNQDWQWMTLVRTKHNGFEENSRRFEEGDVMVRSLVRWNVWRGISIQAGVNDVVDDPGFYGGFTAELLDDDIRNLLTVFRLTP